VSAERERFLAQLRNDEALYGFSVISPTGERVDPRSITAVTEMMTRPDAESALAQRLANPIEQVDMAKLPAGAPMTYYCKHCGYVSCVLPEDWTTGYKKYCDPCQHMIDEGWLTPNG
jgi:hypothetical protein